MKGRSSWRQRNPKPRGRRSRLNVARPPLSRSCVRTGRARDRVDVAQPAGRRGRRSRRQDSGRRIPSRCRCAACRSQRAGAGRRRAWSRRSTFRSSRAITSAARPRARRPSSTRAFARAVIGTFDPNPRTNRGGVARLREAGIEVEIAGDARALQLVEPFARAVRDKRAYLTLKMAMSVDGAITSKPGVQEWITGEPERLYVRDLRIAHDAVMVGAGTVRVDDPQLTVRPPHDRLRPYVRVVVCETDSVPPQSRDLRSTRRLCEDRRPRAGRSARALRAARIGRRLALRRRRDAQRSSTCREAMRALYAHGISSVLCEGGPTLAARSIAAGLVDRMYWAIAPRLSAESACRAGVGRRRYGRGRREGAVRPRGAGWRRRDDFWDVRCLAV